MCMLGCLPSPGPGASNRHPPTLLTEYAVSALQRGLPACCGSISVFQDLGVELVQEWIGALIVHIEAPWSIA